MREVAPPDAAALAAAERVVRAHLGPTPLVPAPALGDDVWLKLETFQPTGAFKVRGALAALAALPAGAAVVTASAGNHGLGVAWAAAALGRTATVVVPANASAAKVAALRATGVALELVGTSYEEAEARALELAAGGEAVYVSPYNDTGVIAGQATLGPELDAQLPGAKVVVVPLGGGGLAAGLCAWAADRDDLTLVGVEAEASPVWTSAKEAGGVVAVDVQPTLADGLAGNLEPGSVTWGMVDAGVGILAAATEDRIAAGMRFLAREHGLVAEGAGAAGVLVAPHMTGIGDPVVVVVTGRNVALDVLAGVLAG